MQKQQNIPNHVAASLCAATETFELSREEHEAIENEKQYYENARAASIEALKIVQKNRGYVSNEAIAAISQILGISGSNLEEVATFYSQIFLQPVGRHIIRYCDSVVCYITGCQSIQIALEQFLKIKPGQTTDDGRFTLLPTCCIGNCDKGPTMMVNEDTYAYLKPEGIGPLLEEYQ